VIDIVAAVSLDEDVIAELRELERAHRLRIPRVIDGSQGAIASLDGRAVINFASNDYLGLAADPRLRRAAMSALEDFGTGVGASRLIAGNHREHVLLEAAVADWLQYPGVRLFNSGYAANVGVLGALLRPGDVVFSDELNHASIIDGCRLSRAEIAIVPHADCRALEAALVARSGRRRIVVSESLFSMDGDLCDVETVAALCKRHGAAFVLDEAHAMGAVGPEGRGIAAERGVKPDLVIGTFGKALGSFGAFAVSSAPVADLLWNRARTFVFSTGMPPSVSAASRAAVELVRSTEGDDRRAQLATLARRFRQLVVGVGGAAASAIAPLRVGDDSNAVRYTERLLSKGLFVQGIRPPTVPQGTARLRVGLSAAHTESQLTALAAALHDTMRHPEPRAGQ
jgi:8-amino-7-oxononanoate synthase